MEQIKEELIAMFDDMITHIKAFKHKTYNGIFEAAYQRHKGVVSDIVKLYETTAEEEREDVLEKLAHIIPDYAGERMQQEPKSKRECLSVDYNMNMAVYVTPLLNFSGDSFCDRMAKRMVELWNEQKVTTLTLSYSTYDDIAGGFKKGLCYITTAVCESRRQPDDCYELTILRRYRDEYLLQTEEGRAIVEEYYEIAPALVQIINMQGNARRIYDEIYRKYLAHCVCCAEENRNEECKALYIQMVRELQKKYLYS